MAFKHLNLRPGTSNEAASGPVALVFGLSEDQLPDIPERAEICRIERLPFAFLHAALASVPFAECVVTPLMSDQFDASDMARELGLSGWRGSYVVVTPPLPRPEVVRNELRALCPRVQVTLVCLARH